MQLQKDRYILTCTSGLDTTSWSIRLNGFKRKQPRGTEWSSCVSSRATKKGQCFPQHPSWAILRLLKNKLYSATLKLGLWLKRCPLDRWKLYAKMMRRTRTANSQPIFTFMLIFILLSDEQTNKNKKPTTGVPLKIGKRRASFIVPETNGFRRFVNRPQEHLHTGNAAFLKIHSVLCV